MPYKKFVSMDIAIIGSGRVGSSLAEGLAEAGHRIFMGVRDTAHYSGMQQLEGLSNIYALPMDEAATLADVIIIAAPAAAVPEIAYFMGDVRKKVILDCSFGPMDGPVKYDSGVDAIIRISGCRQVVKCFNTTSYLNRLVSPHLHEEEVEMYVAGDDRKSKQMAMLLSKDLGFVNCYDLGANSKIDTLEEMASKWIRLSTPAPRPVPAGVKVPR